MGSPTYYGSIAIPKALITPELKMLLDEEFPINKYSHDSVEISEENGIVDYSDQNATYGMFEELEDALIESRIPFDRYSSSDFDTPPEWRYYRPEGEGMDVVVILDHDSDPYVTVDALNKALSSNEDPAKAIEEIQLLIEEASPTITPIESYAVKCPNSECGGYDVNPSAAASEQYVKFECQDCGTLFNSEGTMTIQPPPPANRIPDRLIKGKWVQFTLKNGKEPLIKVNDSSFRTLVGTDVSGNVVEVLHDDVQTYQIAE